jgi:hypothetical protein
MSKPKILVTIENGVVQAISANTDVQIVINNYDQEEDNQINEVEVSPIFKDGEAFKMYHRISPPLTAAEILIKEHLKDIKF